MQKTAVAVVRCNDYEPERVESAVAQAVALVPEVTTSVKTGTKTLLKVDLDNVGKKEPGPYVHAALVGAAATAMNGLGAAITIGDGSKGSAWPMWRKIRRLIFDKLRDKMNRRSYDEVQAVYKKIMDIKVFQDIAGFSVEGVEDFKLSASELGAETDIDFYRGAGMSDVAESVGAKLAYFELEKYQQHTCVTARFLPVALICQAACASDTIVSVPKIRPDDDAVFYGAIRNFLSVVPTAVRHTYLTISRLSDNAGDMCIDVLSTMQKPVLAISDGIEAMKDGDSEKPGFVAASCDCVAHDAVVAHLMGYNPMEINTVRAGHESGLGQGLLENIDIREASV